MKKARCIVSYCSSDAKPEDVEVIVRHLDKMAQSKEYNIEFLFDKDLSVGNDLNEFMQGTSQQIKHRNPSLILISPWDCI